MTMTAIAPTGLTLTQEVVIIQPVSKQPTAKDPAAKEVELQYSHQFQLNINRALIELEQATQTANPEMMLILSVPDGLIKTQLDVVLLEPLRIQAANTPVARKAIIIRPIKSLPF